MGCAIRLCAPTSCSASRPLDLRAPHRAGCAAGAPLAGDVVVAFDVGLRTVGIDVLFAAVGSALTGIFLVAAFLFDAFVYASLVITLASGLHYIWHARRIIET